MFDAYIIKNLFITCIEIYFVEDCRQPMATSDFPKKCVDIKIKTFVY